MHTRNIHSYQEPRTVTPVWNARFKRMRATRKLTRRDKVERMSKLKTFFAGFFRSKPKAETTVPRDTFKVLSIGTARVGKTAAMLRYAKNEFSPIYRKTIGVELHIQKIVIDDRLHKFLLFEVGGFDSRYRHNADVDILYKAFDDVVILWYNIKSLESFQQIRNDYWERIKFICHETDKCLKFVLVGSNSDCKDSERKVSRLAATQFASKHNMPWFEISSLTNTNVSEVFELACNMAAGFETQSFNGPFLPWSPELHMKSCTMQRRVIKLFLLFVAYGRGPRTAHKHVTTRIPKEIALYILSYLPVIYVETS